MMTDNPEDSTAKKDQPSGVRLSVIVPNRNGAETIGRCLEALYASDHDSFEVVVVDDCSEDRSVEIIREYPCKLIVLPEHAGAAAARNLGAGSCKGRILFFTDSDCIVLPDTLRTAEQRASRHGPSVIVGGTYTSRPYDKKFFSLFQSTFINYSELKNVDAPDYVATHAMVIHSSVFRDAGGFSERFLPILEDVEFSHRLVKKGYALKMSSHLQVRHVFNYSLLNSFRNAYRKTKYWVIYSLYNRDLFKDSGTASVELKTNVSVFYIMLALLASGFLSPGWVPLSVLPVPVFLNCLVNGRLLYRFRRVGGVYFAIRAIPYYMLLYPLAIGLGSLAGLFSYKRFSAIRTSCGGL